MPTLTQFRQQAAKELGRFVTGTAVSGSSTTALVDTAAPIKSTLSQDDLFTDFYLFRPNAVVESDKVRIVSTYTPSSGTLVPDLPWISPPYSGGVGESYELHAIIEPNETLRELINAALKRCLVVSEFTITPVEKQVRHSLTAVAPWFSDPNGLYNVGWAKTTSDRDEVDPYDTPIRGKVVQDGATFYLVHRGRSFSASDGLIYCQVGKPAYYHCRPAAGIYGAQSGLTLETDESPVAVEWVTAGTLIGAWRQYAHLLEAAANQKLRTDRQEAAAWFQRLSYENFQPPSPRLREPVMAWGPRW